jgi:hypothetical protein
VYLYLLEFTYAVEDRAMVEAWLAEANLSGVPISTQQYDDEIFTVLADNQAVSEDHQKLGAYSAISSCQARRRALYRITTTVTPRSVFHSFPLGEGDEWYAGDERTVYLSMLSHKFGHKQISWLATCSEIVKWEDVFSLEPSPALTCQGRHF